MKEIFALHNLERLIEIKRDNSVIVLLPRIDIEISPTNGDNHMRLINSTLDEVIKKGIDFPDNICLKTVESILDAIPDIEHIKVRMEAEYVVFRKTPITQHETQEMFKILARAEKKGDRIVNLIGAEVTGITACPCAYEGILEKSRHNLKEKKFDDSDISTILNSVAIASHNQRNISILLIEVPRGENIDVEDIIEVLETSMSSRLYEVLKREDEVDVVYRAHLNPNFVEDTVRKILLNALDKFPELLDISNVFASSESLESIHQHNAMAECSTTFGELKRASNIKTIIQ